MAPPARPPSHSSRLQPAPAGLQAGGWAAQTPFAPRGAYNGGARTWPAAAFHRERGGDGDPSPLFPGFGRMDPGSRAPPVTHPPTHPPSLARLPGVRLTIGASAGLETMKGGDSAIGGPPLPRVPA